MASPAALTAQRRAVAAALLFLLAGALAGVALRPQGVEYRTLGVTEGVFALFLCYVLLLRGVWVRPAGGLGWVAVAYGAWANAQLLELLFPPPGVLEWLVLSALALTGWAALGGGSRERVVAALASLALLLAILNFSVIPALWERAGPAPGTAFGLGDLAEGVRRLLVDYRPLRPAGQVVAVAALALWAAATRLLWEEQEGSPVTDHQLPADG